MKTKSLLIEIGTEELPAAGLYKLARIFARGVASGLLESGVVDDDKNINVYVTPRRLAVLINNVLPQTPTRVVERRGPSLKAAFDDAGKPTKAAIGFAKSCDVDVAKLGTIKIGDGEWLVHNVETGGEELSAILTACLQQAIRKLPMPKRMRWGSGSEEFLRPVHWLVTMHGDAVIPTEILGLNADRFTRGHRFHADKKIRLKRADEYADKLESDGMVIVDFARRRDLIKTQIAQLADGRVEADESLLDLVTGMVEFPVALMGEFDKRFLKLPGEVLVSCMVAHQKYFHFRDANGDLLPNFIAVANIKSSDPNRVRIGNERVLRARLADAEFFWHNDKKTPLESHVENLSGVVFHNRLGTLRDKTARIQKLAAVIAKKLHADANQTARAALLCKADLVTDMVGEFPELQGVMGRCYAAADGEDATVADAIEAHYLPRRRFGKGGDEQLPQSTVAQSVAIADRVDSLVGIFAAGDAPSGDKDPFALRRAALGVLRIVIEQALDLDLREVLEASRKSYDDGDEKIAVTPDKKTVAQVFDFVLERLKSYYQPHGYSVAQLAAVLACRPTKPLDFDRRLKALARFFTEQADAAESLAAANKRIKNILAKADDKPPKKYDASLFKHEEETELARQLEAVGARVKKHFVRNQYDDGFAALAELKTPVDAFFDGVMVMEKDAKIRNNRLALLAQIRALFLDAADISHLGGER